MRNQGLPTEGRRAICGSEGKEGFTPPTGVGSPAAEVIGDGLPERPVGGFGLGGSSACGVFGLPQTPQSRSEASMGAPQRGQKPLIVSLL
jgi:hypothetical protein